MSRRAGGADGADPAPEGARDAGLEPGGEPPAPAELAAHYSRFRVGERILLTGHSHQAWPDVGFRAQSEAWLDAARYVDDKWEAAYEQADRVRDGWRALLGGDSWGEIALGANTHELVARFLSALPLDRRRTIVTTDAEFHTIRRQLDRLGESGWVRVVKVAGRPVESVADRLAAVVDGDTAAVLVSSVYFETAEVVPGLERVSDACQRHGAELLVDAYHHLNALPFEVEGNGLERAWVVGGGYKYCQLGEGNCFLRFPADTDKRPVYTGWFAEFAELAERKRPGEVPYGVGPARFMGATYDPASNYRAAAVFGFFREWGLTPSVLRAISRRQVGRIVAGLEPLVGGEALPGLARGLDNVGGFVAVRLPGERGTVGAAEAQGALREAGIWTDHRGDLLRLGPAPYVTDAQIDEALGAIEEVLTRQGRRPASPPSAV